MQACRGSTSLETDWEFIAFPPPFHLLFYFMFEVKLWTLSFLFQLLCLPAIMDSYSFGTITKINSYFWVTFSHVFYQSSRKVINTEADTREWAVDVKNLTMCFWAMWKTLELWTGTAVECCKLSLMGLANRSLEDSSTESTVEFRAWLRRLQEEGSKNLHSNWTRGHSCDILIKNLAISCPVLRTCLRLT